MKTTIENYDEGKSVARFSIALIITMFMLFISYIEIKPVDFTRFPILFVFKLGMCLPIILFMVFIVKNLIEEINNCEKSYDSYQYQEILFSIILFPVIAIMVSAVLLYGSLTWLQGYHQISSSLGILGWCGFLLAKSNH